MLFGLCITGVIYVVVSLFTVAIVPIGQLSESTTPLLDVVKIGAPNIPIDTIYPFLTIFAVANTALINMLMASRLLYGMAKQGVIPGFLSKVLPGRRTPWTAILFTTALGMLLIVIVNNIMGKSTASALGGTTALLLLGVFTVVNVAAIILRRDRSQEGHDYFHAPRVLPYLGAVTCAFLLGPWAQDTIEYQIALVLIALGVVLWLVNFLYARLFTGRRTRFQHPEDIAHLEDVDR